MKKVFLAALLGFLFTGLIFSQDKEDALLLYKNKQYDKAAEVCLKELESYPEDAVSRRMDSYSVLCWSLLQQKKYNEVIQYGEEALKLSYYDYRIIEVLGEAYFMTGKTLKALDFFQRYTVLNPTGDKVSIAYYFMGEIFIQLGEYNHADIALTTALYHKGDISKWWSRLGYAREMAEEYESALVAYEKALALQPGLEDAEKGLERVKARL